MTASGNAGAAEPRETSELQRKLILGINTDLTCELESVSTEL